MNNQSPQLSPHTFLCTTFAFHLVERSTTSVHALAKCPYSKSSVTSSLYLKTEA